APADIAAATDPGMCGATVAIGNATASDNCGVPVVTAVRSDELGLNAPYPKGVTTITWTATDSGGQKATATQRITVADHEAPRVNAPADVTTSTDPRMCSATVAGGIAGASDNCPGVIVSATRSDLLPLSAAYPKGLTAITWTATDASGLVASSTQQVTVVDTEGPAISRIKTGKKELWPPN